MSLEYLREGLRAVADGYEAVAERLREVADTPSPDSVVVMEAMAIFQELQEMNLQAMNAMRLASQEIAKRRRLKRWRR